MFFPPRNIVESVKKEYPSGTRVELVSMNDPYRDIPEGTRGTVDCVDDTGTIHVAWDNGCHLGRIAVLGVGCRRGTPAGHILELLADFLARAQVSCRALCRVCSIDLKANDNQKRSER